MKAEETREIFNKLFPRFVVPPCFSLINVAIKRCRLFLTSFLSLERFVGVSSSRLINAVAETLRNIVEKKINNIALGNQASELPAEKTIIIPFQPRDSRARISFLMKHEETTKEAYFYFPANYDGLTNMRI